MNEPEDNLPPDSSDPSPEELVQSYTPESPRRALLNEHLKWWDSMNYWFVPNCRLGYESDFESQANSKYFHETYPWLDKLGDAVSSGMAGFDVDKFEGFSSFDHRLDSIDEGEFQAFLDDADTAREGYAVDEQAAYDLEMKETERWLAEEGGSDLRNALHEKFASQSSFFHFLIEQLQPNNLFDLFRALEMYPERYEGDSVHVDEDRFAEAVSEEMIQAHANANRRLMWGQTKRRSYRKFSEAIFTKALGEAVASDPSLSERVAKFTPYQIENLFLSLVPDVNYALDGVPKWTFDRLDYTHPIEWFVAWDLSDEDKKSHYAIKRNIEMAAMQVAKILGPDGVRRWKPPEPKEQLKLRLPRRTRTEADHARARAIADCLLEARPKKPQQPALPLEDPEPVIDPAELVQASYDDESHVYENSRFRVIRVTSTDALRRYFGTTKVPPQDWETNDYFLVFAQGRQEPYYFVRKGRDNFLTNVPDQMREEVEQVILKHYRKKYSTEDPAEADPEVLWPMFKLGGAAPMRHIIRRHVSPDYESTNEFAFHYGIHLLKLGRWRSALKYLGLKPERASRAGYAFRIADWDKVTDEVFADTRDSDHRKTAEALFSGEARDWFWEHSSSTDPDDVASALNDKEWKMVRDHIHYMELYPNGADDEPVVMQPSVLAQYTNEDIIEWIRHQDEYDPENSLEELRDALKRIATETEIDSMESELYNEAIKAIEDAIGSEGKWISPDGKKDVLEFVVPWSHIVGVYDNYLKAGEDWFGGDVWDLLMKTGEKHQFSDLNNYGTYFGSQKNDHWHDHADFYLSELPETEPPSDPASQLQLPIDEPSTPRQPNESVETR